MTGFASCLFQTIIDQDFSRNLDGSIDKLSKIDVQAKADDVQTDAIVRQGNTIPTQGEIRWNILDGKRRI